MWMLLMFGEPLLGLILSQQRMHTTPTANRYEAQIQIGEMVYIADDVCKHVEVGKSYPVELDGRRLKVFVGDKTCKFRIVGQRTTKSSAF